MHPINNAMLCMEMADIELIFSFLLLFGYYFYYQDVFLSLNSAVISCVASFRSFVAMASASNELDRPATYLCSLIVSLCLSDSLIASR